MRCRWLAAPLVAFVGAVAIAQTSASFKMTESTINAGGDPRDGTVLASPHFHVKLDALGEAAALAGLTSASFHVDEGFVGRYPPPGEVTGTRWTDKTTMAWNAERSAGRYEVYRDALATLPGSFGSCFAAGVAANVATDAASPPSGQGWFYLVTVRNRLNEEGPKGYRSGGIEEANPAPCP